MKPEEYSWMFFGLLFNKENIQWKNTYSKPMTNKVDQRSKIAK